MRYMIINLIIMILCKMSKNVCLMIFEKLRHRCKDFKKVITSLTLDLENTKNEYEIVIENRNDLQKVYDNTKSEIEALRLELESKNKALLDCMNENVALKLSINEKPKQCSNKCSRIENRIYKKKHGSFTCYNYGRKGHMFYNCCYMKNDSYD